MKKSEEKTYGDFIFVVVFLVFLLSSIELIDRLISFHEFILILKSLLKKQKNKYHLITPKTYTHSHYPQRSLWLHWLPD